MKKHFETETGEVYTYPANQEQSSNCKCGGNCKCKTDDDYQCECGGNCGCK